MKVAIIGVGNIGAAIAKGLSKGSFIKPEDITCADHSGEALDKIKQFNDRIRTAASNVEAVKGADIVVLAVKPWLIENVVSEIKQSLDYENQLIVSIAAGISFDTLATLLQKSAEDMIPVMFRIIPNTAIEVGESMTFVVQKYADKEQTDLILRLFSEMGKTLLIEERLITVVTALGSCGIAFAFRYIRATMEAGIEMGLNANQAKEIAMQTLQGAVSLLAATGNHPEAEIDKVTTPGGITIKGINELEHRGFTSTVIEGYKACQ